MRLSNSEIIRESSVNVRSACNAHLDSTRRMCDAPTIYGPRKQVHSLDFIIIERWLRRQSMLSCIARFRKGTMSYAEKNWTISRSHSTSILISIHRRFTIATWFSLVHRVRCVNEPRTRTVCLCICMRVYIWEWAVKVLPDQPIGTRSRIGEIELILCICSRVACAPICVMESRKRNVRWRWRRFPTNIRSIISREFTLH